MIKLWKGIKKLLFDIALTFYDDCYKLELMSLPRLWFNIFGFMFVVTWVREEFYGIKYSSWAYLTTGLATCAGAYAFKKVSERGKADGTSNTPTNTSNGRTGQE